MSRKEKRSTERLWKLISLVAMGRLLYLDNLRSFALFLGIIFHAAIVYAPKIGYAIQNDERANIFGYFCYYIHSFRMPLFYMISGYFSILVWEKKGSWAYIQSRIYRIFIPMCLGLLFLAPIQYYLVTKLRVPSLHFWNFYPLFFTTEYFGHSHIWFLVDLLLFSLVFIFIPKSFFQKLILSLPNTKILLLPIYILFVFSFVLIAHSFFPRGDDFLGIDKLTFVYQGGFFFIGILSYQSKSIFEVFPTQTKFVVWNYFFAALIVFLLFYEIEITDPLWMPYFSYGIEKRATHLFLWVLSPILWTRFFVLLFARFANVSNPFTVYLVDSSLPIYLLHHPISLLVAFYFRNWQSDVFLKFFLHTGIVFSLSFLLYDTLIKNSTILRKVFGLK